MHQVGVAGDDGVFGSGGGVNRLVTKDEILEAHIPKAPDPQPGGDRQDQDAQGPGPLLHLQKGMQAQGQDQTISQIEDIDEIAVRDEQLEQEDAGHEVNDQTGQQEIAKGLEAGR